MVANDSPCGSTIGPMMSAKLGVRTVDIGGPTLSMHSIREMCCTTSVYQSRILFQVWLILCIDTSLIIIQPIDVEMYMYHAKISRNKQTSTKHSAQ